ncbi:MAG: hypothetical protein FWB83_08150 [Treponema sp.]|nr:hypothetical protein [Treponema sp.]
MQSSGIKDVNAINQLFKERPNYFRWVGPDGFGNNANEGPLWIRPDALMKNCVEGYNQVAGHTENHQPKIVKNSEQTFVFCDSPEHSYLTVLDTSTNVIKFVDLME